MNSNLCSKLCMSFKSILSRYAQMVKNSMLSMSNIINVMSYLTIIRISPSRQTQIILIQLLHQKFELCISLNYLNKKLVSPARHFKRLIFPVPAISQRVLAGIESEDSNSKTAFFMFVYTNNKVKEVKDLVIIGNIFQ